MKKRPRVDMCHTRPNTATSCSLTPRRRLEYCKYTREYMRASEKCTKKLLPCRESRRLRKALLYIRAYRNSASEYCRPLARKTAGSLPAPGSRAFCPRICCSGPPRPEHSWHCNVPPLQSRQTTNRLGCTRAWQQKVRLKRLAASVLR